MNPTTIVLVRRISWTVWYHPHETLRALVFQRSEFGVINSKISNIFSRLPITLSFVWIISSDKYRFYDEDISEPDRTTNMPP
ncbi:hypothetical protein L1987_24140 [Smallanthus sonchifolius]|uniref:Uncharacterized protein n=1 Tax=Smallanthus sonchifolius TaxID=185202 RepID=A0ACB9IIV2_9ASTR|nr:hypothetical protein L1987_24140 [Smallanthus sonchifolius]